MCVLCVSFGFMIETYILQVQQSPERLLLLQHTHCWADVVSTGTDWSHNGPNSDARYTVHVCGWVEAGRKPQGLERGAQVQMQAEEGVGGGPWYSARLASCGSEFGPRCTKFQRNFPLRTVGRPLESPPPPSPPGRRPRQRPWCRSPPPAGQTEPQRRRQSRTPPAKIRALSRIELGTLLVTWGLPQGAPWCAIRHCSQCGPVQPNPPSQQQAPLLRRDHPATFTPPSLPSECCSNQVHSVFRKLFA